MLFRSIAQREQYDDLPLQRQIIDFLFRTFAYPITYRCFVEQKIGEKRVNSKNYLDTKLKLERKTILKQLADLHERFRYIRTHCTST